MSCASCFDMRWVPAPIERRRRQAHDWAAMTRHRGASRSSAYQPPAAHGAGDLRVDGELPPDLARLETELAPASLGLRLRVFVHARALDEQLARGASPLGDR